ncbi:HK97 family phage prohead protease [Algimonas porphyrae]|uniref:Primosome assembly protein PriA n=1 Tax=Algimonas porphyrae TaxID=1128113 RepID=A0ABQ5V131_9PROT|nr:HK97 family phage prohead protease [Algimonas porphyrae]GLQ20384.1 primosome assembly protein PriA [Algimonas porphyrae]
MTQTKHGRAVLRVKANGEPGEFSGYGSIFGNVDSYRDVVMPGAFTKSIARHKEAGTRPKMFWQHDPGQPIGSWTSFEEDETGLLMSGKLNMDVQRGAEAYALLKAGDIDGMSIGYWEIETERDDDGNTLKLTELDLVEVSVVSIGANDKALVSAVKAEEAKTNFIARVKAGDQPSIREAERFLRDAASLSKSEAEAVVRGIVGIRPGDPDSTKRAFWEALTR